jgi:hypothetical protein
MVGFDSLSRGPGIVFHFEMKTIDQTQRKHTELVRNSNVSWE